MTERVVWFGGGVPVRLWTHEEAAAWLRVEPLHLTHLIAAGAGPVCYWVGRHRRYVPAEVLAWLRTTAEGARIARGRTVTTADPAGDDVPRGAA